MEVDTSLPQQTISSSLNAQTVHERRRAIAALLRRPLLTPGEKSAADFMLVRRHAVWLREWFTKHCQWTLHVESELARLRKTPGDFNDSTRPLLDSKEQPFTRRRYVVLCLALAVLEKSERQTVLRRLAEDIAGEFASDPQLDHNGVSFDLALREHRRDLVEVIKYLIDLRVLTRVDGDEQHFLASREQDVLYNINGAALAAMLNVRRGPSMITARSTEDRVNAMVDEPFPDSEEGRHRRLRTRLFRRLLNDPVTYYSQLSEEERAYFISQRPSIVKEIENATGLVQEARREGVAMIDPDELMTDVKMPEEGTDGHATLLIAEHLANRLRGGVTDPMSISELGGHVETLIRQHQHHWRKDVGEPGAAGVLLHEALRRMEMLRLIDLDHQKQAVTPLPAVGRFAVGTLRDQVSSMGEMTPRL
jgi:uncharacterized protein (TIGR02678 family)